MRLGLKDGLVHTQCQDDIILLDLEANRYFALPRDSHAAFRQLVEVGALEDAEVASLTATLGPEIIVPDADMVPQRALAVPAITGVLERPDRHASLGLLASTIFMRGRIAVKLQVQSLLILIRQLEREKAGILRPSANALEGAAIADAFHRSAALLPVKDRCLSVSVALMSALLARSISASLVIGIRTSPFAAHCWVQIGDQLVNERPENVLHYQPILVV